MAEGLKFGLRNRQQPDYFPDQILSDIQSSLRPNYGEPEARVQATYDVITYDSYMQPSTDGKFHSVLCTKPKDYPGRPERSPQTIPASSSHSQPMDIFLFHWIGTSWSWKAIRPAVCECAVSFTNHYVHWRIQGGGARDPHLVFGKKFSEIICWRTPLGSWRNIYSGKFLIHWQQCRPPEKCLHKFLLAITTAQLIVIICTKETKQIIFHRRK